MCLGKTEIESKPEKEKTFHRTVQENLAWVFKWNL